MKALAFALTLLLAHAALAEPITHGQAVLLGDDPAHGVAVADVTFKPITSFDGDAEWSDWAGYIDFDITATGLVPGTYDVYFSGPFDAHGPLLPALLADLDGNADYQARFSFDHSNIDWQWRTRFDQQIVVLTHTGWQTGGEYFVLSGTVAPTMPEPSAALLLLAGVIAALALRPAHPSRSVASR